MVALHTDANDLAADSTQPIRAGIPHGHWTAPPTRPKPPILHRLITPDEDLHGSRRWRTGGEVLNVRAAREDIFISSDADIKF